MEVYRCKQILTLVAGTVVGLSPDQARRRLHKLESIGEGRYKAKASVQFKSGEVISLEVPVPKWMNAFVGPLSDDEKRSAKETEGTTRTLDHKEKVVGDQVKRAVGGAARK